MYYLLVGIVSSSITALIVRRIYLQGTDYGFKLGKGSSIEPGLYITAHTQVYALSPSDNDDPWRVVRAGDLDGQPGIHFRRNSLSGSIEVVPDYNKIDWDSLNAILH